MILTFGPPISAPGVPVAFPPLEVGAWCEGVSDPLPKRLVVFDQVAITTRVDAEAGGRAVAEIVVAENGTPGLQVRWIFESPWDTVLVDSFQDSLCPGVDPTVSLGLESAFFMGRGDAGAIVRLNRGHQELGATVQAFVRPNVVAPRGVSGRCLFQNLYVVVENSTGGLVRVTPVVDGLKYTAEAVVFAVPSDGSTRSLHRFEVPISQAFTESSVELARAGIVGTWFTAEIEVLDAFGCGRIEFGGMELEFAPLSEDVDGTVYTGESQSTPLTVPTKRWFMGTASGLILHGATGTEDNGEPIAVLLEYNEIAPAGAGGECLWEDLFVVFSRMNAADWTVTCTPFVDGVPLEPMAIELAGVAEPVTEVVNVPLSQPFLVEGVEAFRVNPRGAWFKARFTATAAPDQDVIFEGVDVSYDVLTESVEAVTDA